jgi:hypothetical protein
MVLLALKILAVWSVASLAVGLFLGAVIRTVDSAQKELFLAAAFAGINAKNGSGVKGQPTLQIGPARGLDAVSHAQRVSIQ